MATIVHPPLPLLVLVLVIVVAGAEVDDGAVPGAVVHGDYLVGGAEK